MRRMELLRARVSGKVEDPDEVEERRSTKASQRSKPEGEGGGRADMTTQTPAAAGKSALVDHAVQTSLTLQAMSSKSIGKKDTVDLIKWLTSEEVVSGKEEQRRLLTRRLLLYFLYDVVAQHPSQQESSTSSSVLSKSEYESWAHRERDALKKRRPSMGFLPQSEKKVLTDFLRSMLLEEASPLAPADVAEPPRQRDLLLPKAKELVEKPVEVEERDRRREREAKSEEAVGRRRSGSLKPGIQTSTRAASRSSIPPPFKHPDEEAVGGMELNGNFTTTSGSVEDLSEYTDADESMSAPTEILAEFLSSLMKKEYETALKYCRIILQYEPNNSTAKEFQPLILEKILQAKGNLDEDGVEGNNNRSSTHKRRCGRKGCEKRKGKCSEEWSSSCSSCGSSSGAEDEESSESSSESSESSSSKGEGEGSRDSDGTTASYSSLEEDEAERRDNAFTRADNGNTPQSLLNSDSESPTEPVVPPRLLRSIRH